VHLKLIYNPAAGCGRARRYVREIEEYLRARTADPSRAPAPRTRAHRGGELRAATIAWSSRAATDAEPRHSRVRSREGTLALIPTGSGDDLRK
jgi:diacylglycerol kinase family enzyme